MPHSGILAADPDGAATCFLTYCRGGAQRLGGHVYPDITLDYIAFGHSLRAWQAGDVATVEANLARSVDRLAAAGADFFICPDNMGSSLYPSWLGTRGITAVTPTHEDEERLHGIIFGEPVNGRPTDESRTWCVELIRRLAEQGCDAVALDSTELPLLPARAQPAAHHRLDRRARPPSARGRPRRGSDAHLAGRSSAQRQCLINGVSREVGLASVGCRARTGRATTPIGGRRDGRSC